MKQVRQGRSSGRLYSGVDNEDESVNNVIEILNINTTAITACSCMRATMFWSTHQTLINVPMLHYIPPPDLSTIASLLSVRSVILLV